MKRRFRIYAGRFPGEWRWECSLCQPVAVGGRSGPDAWAKVIAVSLPGHMMRRSCHHAWVARNR